MTEKELFLNKLTFHIFIVTGMCKFSVTAHSPKIKENVINLKLLGQVDFKESIKNILESAKKN